MQTQTFNCLFDRNVSGHYAQTLTVRGSNAHRSGRVLPTDHDPITIQRFSRDLISLSLAYASSE